MILNSKTLTTLLFYPNESWTSGDITISIKNDKIVYKKVF